MFLLVNLRIFKKKNISNLVKFELASVHGFHFHFVLDNTSQKLESIRSLATDINCTHIDYAYRLRPSMRLISTYFIYLYTCISI